MRIPGILSGSDVYKRQGIHGDCSLYFTEGILKNPVKRNYQYEYAVRLRNKNIWLYHDKHRIVKHNIAELTDTLQMCIRDRHEILPAGKNDIAINFMILPEFFDVAYTMAGSNNILADFLVHVLRQNEEKGE